MKKLLLSVFVATVMALTSAGISFAAENGPQGGPPHDGPRGGGGGPQGGPGGGQEGGRRGGFNHEEMQNRMYEMLKTRLGSTDEEWAILKPRVENVINLSQSERMSGFNMFRLMMMFRDENNQGGMRRGGRNNRQRPEGMEESETEKAVTALEEVVKNENATEAEAKTALAKVREEREAARKALAKAREELRELLTVKQEALLVAIGLLD